MNSNLNEELKNIFELNLDPIKVKLMHKESGEGWSMQRANAVELEYRRFLCLMKLYPQEQAAPLVDVDIFWHYHILDTMKYSIDCQHIFGYFLHHFPYVGLLGEGDEGAHHRVGVRMQELYETTFGEAYIRRDENAAARGLCARSSEAQNDPLYSSGPASERPVTAWCSQMQGANDSSYSVPPALTAWCSQMQSLNDSAYMVAPALGSVMTAWCSQIQRTAGSNSASVPRAFGTPITAWCSQALSANDGAYAVAPTLRTASVAWCSQTQSANASAYSTRPVFAAAA